MKRPKFSIRSLLIITATACCGLTIATQYGRWWFALLVTILLANVACVVLALGWFLLSPMFAKKRIRSQDAINLAPDTNKLLKQVR